MKMGTLDRLKDSARISGIAGCLLAVFVLVGLYAYTEQPCNYGQFIEKEIMCRDCKDWLSPVCLECTSKTHCLAC